MDLDFVRILFFGDGISSPPDFMIIDFNWMQRIIKSGSRLFQQSKADICALEVTRRIDFSTNLFSCRIAPTYKLERHRHLFPSVCWFASCTSCGHLYNSSLDVATHNKRRIWQETVSVLLLTDPDCKIPEDQSMHFAQSRDSEFPPYLLNFAGTPGERHVENIRVSWFACVVV